MNRRDTAFAAAAIKLSIFTVVSLVVTGMLVIIMGGFGLGSQTEYKAVFSNASELTSGDDVRIAGVIVGKVKDVKIYNRDQAMVTFKVKDGVPLTRDSRASIRFLNLIGDRYMQIKLTPVSEGGLLPTTLDDVVTLCRATPAAPICSPAGDAVDQLCSVLSTLPLCSDADVDEVAAALSRAQQGGADSTTSPDSEDSSDGSGSTPEPDAGGGGSDSGLVELIGGLLGGGSS